MAHGWTKHLKSGPQIGRKTMVATVAFALVVTTFPLAAFLTAQPAKAAWYNDDWHYRKSILFTHSSVESNVYLNLSGANALDTSASGKFQSDCGDLRFTDSTGKILPYYLVSGCGTSTTVVHVLFGSMPAGDQYLYVYYGNPSVANGTTSFDFATAATGITFGSVGAEETSQGPIAEWKFDEGYGTTAHDSSTNGNTGTLTNGPTWQDPSMCVSGKCLQFDGVDDKVATSTGYSASSITSQAWVYVSKGTAGWPTIIDFGTPGAAIYMEGCAIGTGVMVGAYVGANGNAFSGQSNEIKNCSLSGNQWHFIVQTVTSTTMSLYTDGRLYSTSLGTYDLTKASNAPNIGNGRSPFQGRIDDPRIYNYARNLTQVQQDYNAGIQQMNQQQGNLSNGLVGYWKMDEASWNGTSGEVKDSSGAGSNGVAVGGATTAAGKFGNAGSFNGSSYASIPSTTSTESITSGDATFSFWLNQTTRDPVNHEVFLEKFPGSNAGGWAMRLNTNGQLYARLSYSSVFKDVFSGTDYLSTNNWYFVSLVINRKKNQAQWYINGQPSGTAADITGLGSLTAASPPNIDIGAGAQAFGTTKWQGSIDDVRLYSRAVSVADVQQLYNFGPPPVAAYNFEEGSGTTVNDVSGNGNTATLTNGPAFGSGVSGKSLSFDGVDDYTQTPDAASLDSVGAMTASAWVNVAQQRTGSYILCKIDTFRFNGWMLRLDSSGHVAVDVADASSYYTYISTATLNTGTWYFLTVTYIAPSLLNVYVNGSLWASVNPNKTMTSTNRALYMGTPPWGLVATPTSNYKFNGKIDGVKIYNYARSQTQILQDMNGAGSALDSPVGYWKMDEGQGTTIHNSGIGGTALDGTVSNTTWTTAGKNGNALNFTTASVSKVDVGASVPVAATNPISVSAWINMADFGQYHSIFSLDFDFVGQKGLWLAVDPSSVTSKLFVEIGNGSGIYKYTSMIPPLNTWIQYSVVYDPINARLTQYVNGQVVRADAGVPQVVLAATHSAIGNDYIRGLSFSGKLDEVKVWDSALSQQDILADYNRAVSVKSGSPGTENVTTKSGATSTQPSNTKSSEYCVPGDTSACAGPVGEWKFEEGTGSLAKDTSGNGYDMNYAVAAPAVTSGKIGKALAFDGSSTSMVSTNSSAGALANTLTIEAWIKPSVSVQPYNPAEIVAKTGSAYYYRLELLAGNVIRFRTFGPTNDSLTTTASVPVNQWSHIVATYDGSIKQIYINGQLSASVAATGAMNTFGDLLDFGGFNGGNRSIFQGAIDQVRLFGYARTPAQVAWDYNKGGPVAQYKMDECSGTTIHDASGNGLNGTLNLGSSGVTAAGTCQTSGTAWGNGASGKINSGMSFDGVDDYVDLGTSMMGTASQVSLSAWIKPNSTNVGTIIAKNGPFYLAYGNSQQAQTTHIGGGIHTGTWAWVNGNSVIPLNKWSHISLTYDGATIKVYLNGKLDGSAAKTGSLTVTNGRVQIGGNTPVGFNQYFSGQIDDVQIFNYALTPVQVATLYNGGAVRWGP